MQSSKIIIAIVLVLLVIGGGVGFVLLRTGGSAAPAQDISTGVSGSSYPQDTQGSVTVTTTNGNATGGSSATSTPPPAADPAAEYASLFATISVKPVAFVAASSTSGQYGSVYSLYKDDIANAKKFAPAAGTYSIDVALIDLNGDKTSEAIVYNNLPGFCGTGGCPLDIYAKKGGTWSSVFETLTTEPIALGSGATNGYSDLVLTTGGAVNFMDTVDWYTWDGTTYKKQNQIAIWDGARFNLAQ